MDIPDLAEGQRFNVRVPKTAELVAAHIRRRIVSGELAEDDALPPEGTLMAEFAISRPTLREAFRILESEGLITVRRGARGGARVQLPSRDVAAQYAGLVLQHRGTTLADVFEARAIVEAPAARMVASRRDRGASAKRLAEAHASPAEAGAVDFHRLLVELAGNTTLLLMAQMLEHIAESAGRAVEALEGMDVAARKGRRAHEKLIELVRTGKAAEAEAFWRQHLQATGAKILAASGESDTLVEVMS